MNKEIVNYTEALVLKELGFDEPCIACYDKLNMLATYSENLFEPKNYNTSGYCVSAPLYQQAFKWFREKYKIFSCIMTEYSYGGNISAYHINGLHQSNISKGDFYTYEEAELACLNKLIEIVKNK